MNQYNKELSIHNHLLYKLKNSVHAYAHMLLPCHAVIIAKLTMLRKSLSLWLKIK